MDFGGSEGNSYNIISRQFNLVLNIFRSDICDSLRKGNLSYTTFSQEVTDFNISSRFGNVDGEMRVNESHLVKESSGDTDNHVLNVRANGSDTGQLLTVGEPQVNLNVSLFDLILGLCDLAHFHRNVLEFTGERSELTGDGNNTGVNLDGDYRIELITATKRKREEMFHGGPSISIKQGGVGSRLKSDNIPPSGISTVRDAKTVFMVLFYIIIKLLGNACGWPVSEG